MAERLRAHGRSARRRPSRAEPLSEPGPRERSERRRRRAARRSSRRPRAPSRPRPKRRRIAAIDRAARRRAADRRADTARPAGSTRLTTISPTRMPARSSAAMPSAVSASDSSSGSVTQANGVRSRIAQRAPRSLAPARRAARSGDRPLRDARRARAARESAGAPAAARRARSATAATVSGAASSRSVWPVGAVSTTTTVVGARTRPADRSRAMPISSSTPGIDRPSSASTSSRSSQVPCSRISPSGRRCSASQRANARGASSSTASSDARESRFGVRATAATPSASPSECAGSVETTSTRCAGRSASAHGATPRRRSSCRRRPCRRRRRTGAERLESRLASSSRQKLCDVDAGDLVVAATSEIGALLRAFDLADRARARRARSRRTPRR